MVTTINVVMEDEDADRVRRRKEELDLTWEEYLLLTVDEPERLVDEGPDADD